VAGLFREFAVTLSTAVFVSMIIFSDHDANDVRLSPEERAHRETWPPLHGQRKVL